MQSKSVSTELLSWSWDNFLAARKLVCESHAVFFNAQALRAQTKITTQDIITTSQQYRATLKSLSNSFDPESQKESNLEKELSFYVTIEMIWHCAESLLFSRGSAVLPSLLDWIQTHFVPILDPDFTDCCQNGDNPHEHPQYWPAIFAYAVRGMTKQIKQLLNLHPLSKPSDPDNAFTIIKNLINTMPMINMNSSNQDYSSLLTQWATQIRATLLRSDIFVNRPQELYTLLNIFLGDHMTLAKYSNDWAVLTIALILYTNPRCKAKEIRGLLKQAEQISQTFQSSSKMANHNTPELYGSSITFQYNESIGDLPAHIDDLVRSIFELDLNHLLWGIIEFGHPWFSAHFLDLFSLFDPIPYGSITNDNECSFHERALLEYTSSLMTNRIPIRILADYLGCCPQYGKQHLTEIIARQPLHTEKEALRLLSLCKTFHLTQEKGVNETIVRKIVSKRAKQGMLASAISWSRGIQAQSLADKLLDQIVTPLTKLKPVSGTNQDHPALYSTLLKINLIVDAVFSTSDSSSIPTVSFLKLYSEMLKAYHLDDLKETAILIGRALASDVTPKKFRLDLLTDCTSIVNHLQRLGSGPVFSSEEVQDLMQCLEGTEQLDVQSEQAALIRLSLTHSLSYAILAGM